MSRASNGAGTRRGGLSWILMGAGLLWLLWLVQSDWPRVFSLLARARWGWLLMATLLCALALLPNAWVYRVLLRVHGVPDISFGYAARLHFVGQMVRHMPGRFWGVVYQMNEIRGQLEPLRLMRLTLDFSLIHLIFNLLIPLAVLGFFLDRPVLAAAGLAVGIPIAALGFRQDWWGWWLSWIQYLLPHRFARYRQALVRRIRYRWWDIGQMFIAMLANWSLYLVAWAVLGWTFMGVSGTDFVLLGAAYGIAWLVGFISLVTPGGLAIRETAFVMLAAPLADPGLLAMLALFVRLWLLVVDLLLFLIFVPWHSASRTMTP